MCACVCVCDLRACAKSICDAVHSVAHMFSLYFFDVQFYDGVVLEQGPACLRQN